MNEKDANNTSQQFVSVSNIIDVLFGRSKARKSANSHLRWPTVATILTLYQTPSVRMIQWMRQALAHVYVAHTIASHRD